MSNYQPNRPRDNALEPKVANALATSSELTDELGHFTCKACGVENGHDPSCGAAFGCPYCHVTPDDAEVHGHAPDCPTYVPDPYSALTLLTDTYWFLRRFLVADEAAFIVGALFVAHTHAFDAADASPRLLISSAEAESGKTRWLEVLKLLVRGPVHMVGVSDAALFRLIEEGGRTPLIDEIDTIFGPKARDREDLRGLLDAGYERGATVPRCVGEGSKLKVQEFKVFAPVAMAGLGKLPYTLETRSIKVPMKPRTTNERVEHLRRRKVKPEADALRERWEAWAKNHTPELKDAEPELPDELGDRAQDVWEPLLAIADLAGGDWPKRARAAAVELFKKRGKDEKSIGRRLLADARAVFDDPERDDPVDEVHGQAIASGALATALAAIEGGPWAEWGRDDKPISATKVARMLRPFNIRPDQHKIAGRNLRGYLRSDFEDAWLRHLSENDDDDADRDPDKHLLGESVTDGKLLPPNPNKGNGGNTSRPVTLSPGTGPDGSESDPWRFIDTTAPDHGLKVAQARAEEVLRQRAAEHERARERPVEVPE